VLMEYVDGQALDRVENLEVGPAVLIFHQIAAALAHLHRRGVLHGDLTPGHVLLSRGGQVKVLGYGRNLAREKAATLDEKADLYQLGATMYRVLNGRPARAAGEGGKMSTPTALNPQVPARLNNLVVACLQSNPHKRPEGAFNVEQELKALADEMGLDPTSLRGLARGQAATS